MIAPNVEVGDELAARCTKCKLVLNHILVARFATRLRVKCLTCQSQHAYHAPTEEAGTVKAKRATKLRPKGSAKAQVSATPPELDAMRVYVPAEKFKEGEWLRHKSYGPGQVKAVRGNKLDVEFANASVRTLVHQFALA